MDIMNNMTVSTSKLTFSLIAIAALLVSGSGFMVQEAYSLGAATDAPEFTAASINKTITVLTFDRAVNGTIAIADWGIRILSTATAGDITYAAPDGIAITDIFNGTTSGTRTDGGHIGVPSYTPTDTAANRLHSASSGVVGLGFINGTTLVLQHDAIPTGATYFINYTNNPALTSAGAVNAGIGQIHNSIGVDGSTNSGEGSSHNKILKIGSNATAANWISPEVVSAKILKSNPKQVIITMTETVTNVNSTGAAFTMTTSGGGNQAIPAGAIITNGTKYITVNLQNPVGPLDVLTISHTMASSGGNSQKGGYWITDAINSARNGAVILANTGDNSGIGVGNRAGNFTVSVTNWLEIGMYGDINTCYDCSAPKVSDVKISLDSSIPIKVTDDNKVHISAAIDDTVSVMVTVSDNLGADTIPFAGLYTNFGETPDNLYYSNNFDSAKQMSTSYYEWNVRNDDIAFDNDGAITWADTTAQVNPDRTQTFTYTMTINDEIESSQVWVDIGDKAGNYAKIALPITLEVSGAPGLTFASDDTQKVVSFFNESILLAIVSQWTSTSSDEASNVEQLSSVLGIENQLPTWTTNLASWVAEDKIDVADMIVAVEYVINQ
jgi:hypothetical protein